MDMKKILIIAAHPDDEILGCGGTMAKHVLEGDTVYVYILAEGVTSRDQNRCVDLRKEELSDLRKSAIAANTILGVTSVEFHDFPDNRMDGLELLDIVKIIEDKINEIKPDIIYTHYINDLNIDHQIICKAVITATRPLSGTKTPILLLFEVVSSTEWQTPILPNFSPNWFVNISNTLNLKIQALEAYKSEMRIWPHPRSIEGIECLAKLRGATICVNAAEAFMLNKLII